MREREDEEQPEQMSVTETLQAEQNQTLGEKLSAQIHRTPWWMISMAAHVLLLVLMALCVYEGVTETEETTIVVSTEGTEDGGSQKPDRDSDQITEDEAVSEQDVAVDTPTSDLPVSEAATASAVEVTATESTFVSSAPVATAVEVTSGESYAATALKASVGKATGSPTTGGSTASLFSGAYKGRTKGGKKKGIGKYGGKGTEKAVQDGLAWLAAHQNEDGSWSTEPGAAAAKGHVGATAFALLAFLGDGHGESGSKYGSTVKKAVDWLMEEVDSSGKIKGASGHLMYEQGLASLALNEAYGMNIKRVKDKALKATEFVLGAQNPQGSFDYGGNPQCAGGDTSITGFQAQAMKQAKNGKLMESEAHKGLEGVRKWVESATDANGLTGYRGTGGQATQTDVGGISMTAAGCLMRIYTGSSKSDDKLSKGVDNIMKNLPDGKTINMYYYYYGTIVMFQWQGSEWKIWNDAMKGYVLKAQSMEGDKKGSWDPVGSWAQQWGRTGQTALSCLCLEVYYRYEIILK
jgi:hypothetical protein